MKDFWRQFFILAVLLYGGLYLIHLIFGQPETTIAIMVLVFLQLGWTIREVRAEIRKWRWWRNNAEATPLTYSAEASSSSTIFPPPDAVAIIGEVTCTSPTPFQLVITRAGQQIYRSPWSTNGKVAIDRFPVKPGDSYHLEFKDQ